MINGHKKTNAITHIKRKTGLDKQLNNELERIKEEFKERTKDIPEFWDLRDFLMLLKLAEYGFLGKSQSIICAFKIGYMTARRELIDKNNNHFMKEEADNE